MTSNRYGTIAKQALSEMNLSPNFYYEPLWSENMKSDLMEFLKLIMSAKNESERIVEECNKKINEKRQGIIITVLLLSNIIFTYLVIASVLLWIVNCRKGRKATYSM